MILESTQIAQIENALSDLDLKDPWKEPLEYPLMAIGAVAKFHGKDWDQTQDDFEFERITAEEFVKRQLELIRQYGSHRFRMLLEKNITGIFSHQIEQEGK